MSPDWLDDLREDVAEAADTIAEMTAEDWAAPIAAAFARLQDISEEAGDAVAQRFAGALARIRALPDEAVAAVGELTAVIEGLFPEHDAPPALPAPDSACGTAPRREGGNLVTPRPVPRRLTVEPAAFAAFIRAQHPSKPAEHCAALTGIPLDSVEKMLRREALPNGRNFLLCVVAYGPALIAAVLPDADARWLTGAQILADQAHLEDELARTQAEMAENAERWTFCGVTFRGTAP
ncbi:hypothetical protein [Methylorubrum sp. POS3]|uniref:hypothetical protein n=1 Tax=Methylorubrum sp. POS3 TaxID=2998492 RepID=UPI00372AF078